MKYREGEHNLKGYWSTNCNGCSIMNHIHWNLELRYFIHTCIFIELRILKPIMKEIALHLPKHFCSGFTVTAIRSYYSESGRICFSDATEWSRIWSYTLR